MNRSRSSSRLRTVLLTATVVSALGMTAAVPAFAQGRAPASEADVASVTVRPDPSYQHEEFEGWGTSLVWFANATGGYPDEIRNELADLVFGPDGLNLNIARYNIGGGNAPDVPDYLRPGGAVEGWWKAPEGTTREDTDWWSAEDPADWNEDADRTQRWWIDKIKDSVDTWETFSNSPPWFMTESGYVSGGFDSSADQLKDEDIEDFVSYLVSVTDRLEDAHGIQVDSLDPFNEPNTPYWGTTLGADGNPVGGRQEGAHMGPEMQQKVLRALQARLADTDTDTDASIAAMDETNPGTFVTNWLSYPPEVADTVARMNVHTYGTGQRTAVRDLSKSEDKPLWMSEVEGSWGEGQDFTDMAPGLGMAQHITDDLRELEPSAWVFWQPVEDYDNMKPGGESAAGANWGSIQMPFDCTAEDTVESCPIRTNTKFNTVRNFTHYIRPGDHLIGVDDSDSVAAIAGSGATATVVHTNDTTEERDVVLDLDGFARVSAGSTVTAVVTDEAGALVEQAPVAVVDSRATVRVPARSVTTLVIDGVSGVDAAEAPLRGGRDYLIRGVQSDLDLTAAPGGLEIRTPDGEDANQRFRLEKLTPGWSNRTRYALLTSDGRRAVTDGGGVSLEPASGAPAPEAQWVLSSTGDGTHTLASAAGPRNLEVPGEARTDGSPVGVWQPTANDNQRWRLLDQSVATVTRSEVFTLPGHTPPLPATVWGETVSGGRTPLSATWNTPPVSAWADPGHVGVDGRAVNPWTGRSQYARTSVIVDTVARVRAASATTQVGVVPSLPTTVAAGTTTLRRTVSLPVVWDLHGLDVDEVGTVVVRGRATWQESTWPARAVVTVTDLERNLALEDATAAADHSEAGYPPDRLVDGVLTGKAWSNWQPGGTQRGGGTVTITLPEAREVTRVVVRSHQDGSNVSYPRTVRLEARVGEVWRTVSATVRVDASGPAAPVVEVAPSQALLTTDAVRVVMTADSFVTLSEIEVFGRDLR